MSTVSFQGKPDPDSPEYRATGGPSKATLRRVAVASCIGTTIEFYDFLIYGTAAALVFPTVFFPALGDTAGTVASFGTFAVAFFARPVGAILFGHYGDRIGRKKTLVSTLLIMGLATVLIGVIPTAESIGVAAPILLVALRFAQGFAVGGEWAGATLLAAEYAPAEKRGLYAIFPQLGPSLAFALSSATFLATDYFFGAEHFITFGWRIPFLLSGVLVLIGLYIRFSIDETPVFKANAEAVKATSAPQRLPFLEVMRHQGKEILLSAGALTVMFTLFYTGTASLASYGTKTLGYDRQFVLVIGILAAGGFAATTILSGLYSDRVGRRKVIMVSCVAAVVWFLLLFPMIDTRNPVLFAVGMVGVTAILGVAYGPCGALMPELFKTEYRYTGAGLGYNLGGIFGGSIPPLVAAPLAASFGSFSVGVLLASLGVVSFVCTRALVETSARQL